MRRQLTTRETALWLLIERLTNAMRRGEKRSFRARDRRC
jgi:hypothetical protein